MKTKSFDCSKLTYREMADIVSAIRIEVKRRNPLFVNAYTHVLDAGVVALEEIAGVDHDVQRLRAAQAGVGHTDAGTKPKNWNAGVNNFEPAVGQVWERRNGSIFKIASVDPKFVYYWLDKGSKHAYRSIRRDLLKKYKCIRVAV